MLLGISLEGFELESADAKEADCKPTRNAHFHIDPTLIFFLIWCSTFIEIKISTALKTKVETTVLSEEVTP